DEPRQGGFDRGSIRPDGRLRRDRSLAVVGLAGDAPTDAEAIALMAGGGEPDRLGRLAERQWQNAGSERVERAGMPGLGAGRTPYQCHRAGRGDAFGLVD